MIVAAAKWPTWQQAWITSLICLALYVALRRIRPSRFTEVALPALHELVVLTGLYGLWRTAKKLPLAQSEGAMDRARRIVEFQEAIWLPTELSLQEFVVRYDWLGWSSAAYYIGMHVPGVFAFLIWMFWRHRDQYPRWRNVLALTTAGCLFIRFWHVAPPRFLTDLGYEDLSEVYDMSVYGPVGTGVSGQFVAMPSIHVAWAAVIGFGIISASPEPVEVAVRRALADHDSGRVGNGSSLVARRHRGDRSRRGLARDRRRCPSDLAVASLGGRRVRARR